MSISTYTIAEGTQYGKKAFIVRDQDGNFTGACATQADAEKMVKSWAKPIEEIAQPAFDFTSAMYGSDGQYSQGAGNSETDEDKSFGL